MCLMCLFVPDNVLLFGHVPKMKMKMKMTMRRLLSNLPGVVCACMMHSLFATMLKMTSRYLCPSIVTPPRSLLSWRSTAKRRVSTQGGELGSKLWLKKVRMRCIRCISSASVAHK